MHNLSEHTNSSSVTHSFTFPDPPRYNLLPVAMQSSLQLHGALVRCGPGYRGVGWPDTPRVKLAAIAQLIRGGRVASHMTAAWIWGAAYNPDSPLRCNAPSGRAGLQLSNQLVVVQELRYTTIDSVRFGINAVTTPLRTVVDLLFDQRPFDISQQVACRLLFRLIPEGSTAVYNYLNEHRRPHRKEAWVRFRRLTGHTHAEKSEY